MSKRLESISQTDDLATVTFEDGSSDSGHVVIGADGLNSKARRFVCAEAPPRRWTLRRLLPRD